MSVISLGTAVARLQRHVREPCRAGNPALDLEAHHVCGQARGAAFGTYRPGNPPTPGSATRVDEWLVEEPQSVLRARRSTNPLSTQLAEPAPLDHWPQVRAGLFRRGSARGFGSSAAGRVRNQLASVADRLLKQLSDLAESEQDVDRLDGLVVLQDVVERAGTERHAEAGLVHE